jgi:hypothetical protein
MLLDAAEKKGPCTRACIRPGLSEAKATPRCRAVPVATDVDVWQGRLCALLGGPLRDEQSNRIADESNIRLERKNAWRVHGCTDTEYCAGGSVQVMKRKSQGGRGAGSSWYQQEDY